MSDELPNEVYCVFCNKKHKLEELKTKPFFEGLAYFCGQEQIARHGKEKGKTKMTCWNGREFEYVEKEEKKLTIELNGDRLKTLTEALRKYLHSEEYNYNIVLEKIFFELAEKENEQVTLLTEEEIFRKAGFTYDKELIEEIRKDFVRKIKREYPREWLNYLEWSLENKIF